jgi:hypothetical protein
MMMPALVGIEVPLYFASLLWFVLAYFVSDVVAIFHVFCCLLCYSKFLLPVTFDILYSSVLSLNWIDVYILLYRIALEVIGLQ